MTKTNKKGFTLAEVLITLGIIGVVSVLTIPNIISNYQKKVYVTQLQKAYNQISNALELLMVDEEVDNLNETSLFCDYEVMGEDGCGRQVIDSLKKYIKVTKYCGFIDEDYDCHVEQYKMLNGDLEKSDFYNCVKTNSNFVICFQEFYRGTPMKVFVDVNGKKGPNVLGRDAFRFEVNYKGEFAETFRGYPNHLDDAINNPNICGTDPTGQGYSNGCFMKIINDDWVMDY